MKTLTDNDRKDASLRSFLGYRLKRAYGVLRSDLLAELAPLGLRITTYSALVLIRDNPGISQSELSTLLDIKRPNMVAIIDDLEKHGWIERTSNPNDLRTVSLNSTQTGNRLCKKALAIDEQHETALLGCLSGTEKKQLLRLLKKLETLSGQHF